MESKGVLNGWWNGLKKKIVIAEFHNHCVHCPQVEACRHWYTLHWGLWRHDKVNASWKGSAQRSSCFNWYGSSDVDAYEGLQWNLAVQVIKLNMRFPWSRAVPAHVSWYERQLTIGDQVPCDKGGKKWVLDSGKMLMGGIAALSINGPSSIISRSISDFPPRPHLLKQISQSEFPGLFALCVLEWSLLIWMQSPSMNDPCPRQACQAISDLQHSTAMFPLLINSTRVTKLLNQATDQAEHFKTLIWSRSWIWPPHHLMSLSILLAS